MSLPSFRQFLLLIVVFALTTVSLLAKDPKWREVTPAELAMDKPKVDKDADAEALFWEVRINDSKNTKLSRDHYVRVKIFTELGREKFSKFDIPYTKGYKIKDIAARVIRQDGTIVEIDKNDIFDRDIIKTNKRKIKSKSFAIPNIEPGVIVEYQYTEVIKGAGAVGMTLEFQRDIPVHELSYYYKPYKKNKPRFQPYNIDDIEFEERDKGYYVATQRDVPAFKEEPYMPPSKMVKPWIQLQGLDFAITSARVNPYSSSIKFVIKDPGNPRQFWSAFATEKKSLLNGFTKKDKKLKKEAERIVAGKTFTSDKVTALYNYCQKEIHNLSFDTKITEDELDDLPQPKKLSDIIKHKQTYGTLVDYLFAAMADAVGLEVALVYSGDREEIFFDISMTNEDLVHFAAVAIRDGKDWTFFNPGVPFLQQGQLLWNEENVTAILADKKFGSFQNTPFQEAEKSKLNRTGNLELKEDGTLEGTVSVELTGHHAINYRMENYRTDPSKRIEELKEGIVSRISTASVTDITIENFDDYAKPVIYRYKVSIPSYAQKTGKRIFFQPGYFDYGTNARFGSNERQYDVVFDYGWSENDKLEFTLPEGFALDNTSAPAPLSDSQKIGMQEIKLRHDEKARKLYYDRRFYFGSDARVLFPSAAYGAVKKMFDEFHKAETQTISLKSVAE